MANCWERASSYYPKISELEGAWKPTNCTVQELTKLFYHYIPEETKDDN